MIPILAEVPALLAALGPLVVTAVVSGVVLRLAHWLLLGRDPNLGNERKIPRQLIMLLLTLAAVAALVLSLPVSDSSRNQVLGLVGLIVSGMFAFSSTTMVANFTAGMMLRITKPFRTGDFIHVGEHFGRVSDRGLLDTEVQTEHRDLIAFPNTYLINHPVTTVRASGTIVSVSLSLGYDVHHAQVEPLLKEAAAQAGLSDPFVQIRELGDFTVTYRVAGLLTEVKSLLSTRSELNRHVLDKLHLAGIEIASPSIMLQRRQPDGTNLIPDSSQGLRRHRSMADTSAEKLAFDKAEQAEAREQQQAALQKELGELETRRAATTEETARLRIDQRISTLKEQLALLQTKPADPDE